MNIFFKIIHFVRFYITSKNAHGLHSPFLYNFYQEVVSDNKWYYVFTDLEKVKHNLLNNKHSLDIVELGAGSSYGNKTTKLISTITKQQVSSSYQLRVIWRMINTYQCKEIIELGSSIGLSTAYLGSVAKDVKVSAFEGNPYFIAFAKRLLADLKIDTVNFIQGDFGETLAKRVKEIGKIDLAFLDGNHTKKATLAYYQTIKPYLHDQSIVILDDIYWSKDMMEMWQEISQYPEVRCSVDLYFMGVIFFNPDFKVVLHEKIRPNKFT